MPKLVAIRDKANEPYIIMEFDPDNPQHVQVFADMDRQPEALRWMEPPESSTDEELDKLIRAKINDPNDPRLILAVATRSEEIIGWVQYYPEDMEREKWLRTQMKLPEGALVWETSFLKYLKYEDYKGVAVNGVKQTLEILGDLERTIAQAENKAPRPLVITAYTDPENRASEVVLEKNNFEKLPRQVKYGEKENNVWVKII